MVINFIIVKITDEELMQAVQHVPCIIYESTYVNDATHSGPLKITSNECVVIFLACTRHTDEIPLLHKVSATLFCKFGNNEIQLVSWKERWAVSLLRIGFLPAGWS